MVNLRSFTNYSLDKIREYQLHGIENPPPRGYLRGLDVLDSDFVPALRRSCNAFIRNHSILPNLLNPSTFTEKQLLFKFFAPIPIVSTSDKLGSRVYAEKIADDDLLVPKVIWKSKAPELPQNDEVPPGRYWFKSNHGSGTNMPVTFPLPQQERAKFEQKAENWLKRIHNRRLSLWWYEIFDRYVYLEEDLSDAGGFSADDWKFFVCNGKVVLFQYDQDRHKEHVQTIYDRDGQFIARELYYSGGPAQPLPDEIDSMVAIAEAIGSAFDFMRVDLFVRNKGIYLGEIGLVPNGCTIPIRSPEIDHLLGLRWNPPWLGARCHDHSDFYSSSEARRLFDLMPDERKPPENYKVPWV